MSPYLAYTLLAIVPLSILWLIIYCLFWCD